MRRTRGARVVAVLVTLGVATAFFGNTAREARAQDDTAREARAPDEPADLEHRSRSGEVRTPTRDELERAGVLFERSALAYEERRYDAAVALLVEAYALSREPVLVYNLARAHEGAGELREALDAYRRYVELAPRAEHAPAARAQITRLESALAAQEVELEIERERERLAREEAERAEAEERAREQALRRAEEEEQRRRAAEPSPWPWVVAGTGAAGLVAGAVLGGLALERHAEAVDAETQVQARALSDEAQTLATGTSAALVAGAVLLGVGVTWGLVDLLDRPAHEGGVEVAMGLGSLEIRGAF